MSLFITRFYLLILLLMAVYGGLGLITLVLYLRHRRDRFEAPTLTEAELPRVTVQLPIYNEQFVVPRLLAAAAALKYPADKLQIQVVDDSTDETIALVAGLVTRYRDEGIDMVHCRRLGRDGYKAGALQEALQTATGDFIAIFDADFSPQPDFLHQTVPHFYADAKLGMIQTRWGHLNAADSPLTAAQAIALDKHFAMEQTVRHRADLFPKFNGSGGIWRRTCLVDAGGWQNDTVCEDLCLSTRAILGGWRFRFLTDVVSPAELPNTISAYKNQQARWAKGSFQCLIKFFWSILRSREHSLVARLYAIVAMSGYFANGLLLTLLLLQVPILALDIHFPSSFYLFTLFGIGQPVLFLLAQQVLYPDWKRRLRHLPGMLVIAIGLAPSQLRAMWEVVWEMLRGRDSAEAHPFIRTPKGQGQRGVYQLPFDPIIFIEAGFALYAAAGIGFALWRGRYPSVMLPAMCMVGMSYVVYLGIRERQS